MSAKPTIVDWSSLPETARSKISSFSSLYSGKSQTLWPTIGGELRYLVTEGKSEALPLFVKHTGPLSHAQVFVQGLPVLLPRMKKNQDATLEALGRAYTRVTLVDFNNEIAAAPPDWTTTKSPTELFSITPDFEPPDSDLRSELRKSLREGLVVHPLVTTQDHEGALRLFAIHGKQDRRRFPPAFLAELANLTQFHDDIIWLIARYNDHVVGSQVFILLGDVLLYWLSVLDRTAAAAKPAVALLNEGIRRGAQQGAITCNLGWSPPGEEGLLAFKRRWGSVPHEYTIYSRQPWWWPK